MTLPPLCGARGGATSNHTYDVTGADGGNISDPRRAPATLGSARRGSNRLRSVLGEGCIFGQILALIVDFSTQNQLPDAVTRQTDRRCEHKIIQ